MDLFHAKLVAAATGSTLTALTMTPFDVVKTRLQTQRPSSSQVAPKSSPAVCCQPAPVGCVRNMSSITRTASEEIVCIWDHGHMRTERVRGFWDAVKHVWRAEGMGGLWKGAGTTLVIAVPSATSYMLTYDYFLNVLLPQISPSASINPLLAGISARTVITSIVSPLELVRTNLQSTPLSPSNPHTLRSVLASIRALVHSQGTRSLWRGLGPTLWRDVPFSGIYWSNYEATKYSLLQRGFDGAYVSFVSGAFSGTTAALITSPFDVLKTRRQALLMSTSVGGKQASTSTAAVLSRIVRTEGLSALFAGLTPRIAKIAPACGIMIACYEGIGKALARPRSTKAT